MTKETKPKRQKTGGRQKGTPNKTTSDLKKWIFEFVDSNLEVLKNDFARMDPEDKVNFIIKLLPYVLPKQTETKINVDEEFTQAVKQSVENINDLFK